MFFNEKSCFIHNPSFYPHNIYEKSDRLTNFRLIFSRGQIHSWCKSSQSYWAHHWIYTSSGPIPGYNCVHTNTSFNCL